MSIINLNPGAKCLDNRFSYPCSSVKLLSFPTPPDSDVLTWCPCQILGIGRGGKRPYHNVLIMRRQKQQTSWIVLIKYVWDLETQQLCVQVIQMHFNQLVSSVTFSDTPLRSFLNEFYVLTPELSGGKKKTPYLHFMVMIIIPKAPHVI